MSPGLAHYYVRSEGWERCADCYRRYEEELHADLLESLEASVKKELLKRIKIVKDDHSKAKSRAKTNAQFNRLEHGCLCCTYEDNYGEGQKKATESVAYWTEKMKQQKNTRRGEKNMARSQKK